MIKELLTDNTNLIELYLTNNNDNTITSLNIDKNIIDKIESQFKFKQKVNYVSFYKEDLVYTYELSSDSQFVSSKTVENISNFNKNFEIILYNENKYPTYQFSCTNYIDNKVLYNIKECKINNRICILIKEENDKYSLLIQYKHSNNVDIDKVINIIDNIILKIENNIIY
jgi:hypothetical protein